MKKVIQYLLAGLLAAALITLLAGCSSTEVIRTKSNDPMLRVIIDPRIPVEHYVQIRAALVESGKFEVIDRRDGFEAALQEQDLQFRSGYQDRFSDREKWAHIGKMYGAAGVITASAQCYQKVNWMKVYTRVCKQFLTFINGTTGVAEFSVRGENSEPWTAEFTVPDWNDVIARTTEEYPKYFKARKIDPMLEQYMQQSEEHAKRERAKQERKPASNTLAQDFNMMKQAATIMQQEPGDSNEEE